MPWACSQRKQQAAVTRGAAETRHSNAVGLPDLLSGLTGLLVARRHGRFDVIVSASAKAVTHQTTGTHRKQCQ